MIIEDPIGELCGCGHGEYEHHIREIYTFDSIFPEQEFDNCKKCSCEEFEFPE